MSAAATLETAPITTTRTCGCPLAAVVRAVTWETADGRRRIHLAHSANHCDIGVVVGRQVVVDRGAVTAAPVRGCGADHHDAPGASWPGHRGVALRLTGDCDCLAYLTDAVSIALVFLEERRATVLDPAAMARRHVRSRQHDHVRAARVSQGAQARTDRLENSVIGRALATREQRWLFRDLAEEAGSSAPLEDEAQLRGRLVLRRARRTGEHPDQLATLVAADFAAVRDVAARVGRRVDVGTPDHPEIVTWWEAYIERPLGRRRRGSTRTWDELPWTYQQVAATLHEPDDPAGDTLRRAVHRVLACDATDLDVALCRLLNDLVASGLVSPRSATSVLADPRRRARAVQALRSLHTTPGAADQHGHLAAG